MALLHVGIFGAAGFMGAPFSRALLQAHRGGLLRFIILHRPESDLSRYPKDIEKRVIDLKSRDITKVTEQVKDLQVVVSAVSGLAGDLQYRFIDALKGSKELITFFPSEYATPHRPEDLKSPFLSYSNEKRKIHTYCAKLGVPCTVLANATVPDLLFNFGAAPALDIRRNKLELYWPLGDGKRGLTSREFSGQALVYLLLHRLKDLPNQTFSLIELEFSAQDLIALCQKLHQGQEPTIVKYSEEQYQEDLIDSFFVAMGAASRKGLAVGVNWPGEVVSDFPGWERRILEDYVRDCLSREPVTYATLKNANLSQD